mgnify:CR=1 FL=1|jgi:hypothetical protein
MKGLLSFLLFGLTFVAYGQGSFSPQAGEWQSNAVFKDSNVIRDWAIDCQVVRGLRQIDLPDSGYASTGIPVYATSRADSPLCVSLGDGGSAVLTFTSSFYNGEGADFVVFENGFGQGVDAFLELAHVEVSSDGVNYFRFPSTSEVQNQIQTSTFGNTDASEIHNLAGKYIANFGAPFDLDEIDDTTALDKMHVTHVKIIDVVGKLDTAYGSFDSQENLINDPWPTNFPQSGFDLDAVGIIHSNLPLSVPQSAMNSRKHEPSTCYDLLGRPANRDTKGLIILGQSRGTSDQKQVRFE